MQDEVGKHNGVSLIYRILLLSIKMCCFKNYNILIYYVFYSRSVRSGYAFAHQEGFGRLITSGRIMKQGQQGNPALPNFHTSMIQAMPRMRAASQSKQKSTTTPVQEESIVQDQSNKTEAPDNIRTVQLSINGQSREVPLPNQVSN